MFNGNFRAALVHQVFEEPIKPAAFDEVDAGKLHHLFDLLTVGVFVAMNPAVFALGFGVEWTFIQFLKCIVSQLGAFGAEALAIGVVLLTAVHTDKFFQQMFIFLLFVHGQSYCINMSSGSVRIND